MLSHLQLLRNGKNISGYKQVTNELKSGQLDDNYPVIFEGDIDSEGFEMPEDEWITIDNNNIEEYYSTDYYKKETTTNSGALYVTKADTWLKTTSKEVSELQTPSVDGEGEDPSVVKDSSTEYVIILKNNQYIVINTRIRITETTKTSTKSRSYTVTDQENQINVEDFINLIKKYPKVRGNLESAPEMIFDYLQRYENTQKLEKVMRYVLMMLTGNDYGVSEAKLKTLFNDLFSNSNLMNGSSIEAKVWFTLRAAEFSAEATAGIMGNIEAESGFNPSLNEEGSGIGYGLCQWSFERRTQLENYAASKGVAPSDIETQIEFLIAELTIEDVAGNGAEEFADYQFTSTSDEQALKNAETPEEAAEVFCWKFERPYEETAHIEWRRTSAREYYEYFTGLGDANELQLMIVEVINNPDYRDKITGTTNMCLAWTSKVYDVAASEIGWTTDVNGPANCAACSGYMYGVSNDMTNIPLGAAVYRGSTSWGNGAGHVYGHVGIYIGEGKIAHNLNGVSTSQDPAISTIEEWIADAESIRS